MRLFYSYILIVMIGYAAVSTAETNACYGFYLDQSIHLEIVTTTDLSSLSQGELKIYEHALEKYRIEFYRMVRALSPVVEIPRGLKLHLISDYAEELSNFFSGDIQMNSRRLRQIRGEEPTENKLFSKNPIFNLPLFRHEVGHPIFELALENRYPWLKEFGQLGRDFREKKVSAAAFALATVKGLKKIDRMRAYHELFADFVSVVFSEDPNAIKNALSFSALNGSDNAKAKKIKAENQLRTFVDHVKPGTTAISYHGILWPARQFIWQQYLKRPEVLQHKKAEIIKTLMDALLKETDWILSQDFNVMTNQELMNEHLIETLTQTEFP